MSRVSDLRRALLVLTDGVREQLNQLGLLVCSGLQVSLRLKQAALEHSGSGLTASGGADKADIWVATLAASSALVDVRAMLSAIPLSPASPGSLFQPQQSAVLDIVGNEAAVAKEIFKFQRAFDAALSEICRKLDVLRGFVEKSQAKHASASLQERSEPATLMALAGLVRSTKLSLKPALDLILFVAEIEKQQRGLPDIARGLPCFCSINQHLAERVLPGLFDSRYRGHADSQGEPHPGCFLLRDSSVPGAVALSKYDFEEGICRHFIISDENAAHILGVTSRVFIRDSPLDPTGRYSSLVECLQRSAELAHYAAVDSALVREALDHPGTISRRQSQIYNREYLAPSLMETFGDEAIVDGIDSPNAVTRPSSFRPRDDPPSDVPNTAWQLRVSTADVSSMSVRSLILCHTRVDLAMPKLMRKLPVDMDNAQSYGLWMPFPPEEIAKRGGRAGLWLNPNRTLAFYASHASVANSHHTDVQELLLVLRRYDGTENFAEDELELKASAPSAPERDSPLSQQDSQRMRDAEPVEEVDLSADELIQVKERTRKLIIAVGLVFADLDGLLESLGTQLFHKDHVGSSSTATGSMAAARDLSTILASVRVLKEIRQTMVDHDDEYEFPTQEELEKATVHLSELHSLGQGKVAIVRELGSNAVTEIRKNAARWKQIVDDAAQEDLDHLSDSDVVKTFRLSLRYARLLRELKRLLDKLKPQLGLQALDRVSRLRRLHQLLLDEHKQESRVMEEDSIVRELLAQLTQLSAQATLLQQTTENFRKRAQLILTDANFRKSESQFPAIGRNDDRTLFLNDILLQAAVSRAQVGMPQRVRHPLGQQKNNIEQVLAFIRVNPWCVVWCVYGAGAVHASGPIDQKQQVISPVQSRKQLGGVPTVMTPSELDDLVETIVFGLHSDVFLVEEEVLLLNVMRNAIRAHFACERATRRIQMEATQKSEPTSFPAPGIERIDWLRHNSFVTKLLGAYTRRLSGRRYLQLTLRQPVLELLQELEAEPTTPEGFLDVDPASVWRRLHAHWLKKARDTDAGDTSLNATPMPEECAADPRVSAIVGKHLKWLQRVCQQLLDVIVRMLPRMPFGLRWVCKQLVLATESGTNRSIGPRERSLIIGAFVFLRFFVPALISPDQFGILDSHHLPTPARRRALVLIGKVLQHLANDKVFPESSPLVSLNFSFLVPGQKTLEKYLAELVDVGEPYDALGYLPEHAKFNQRNILSSPRQVFQLLRFLTDRLDSPAFRTLLSMDSESGESSGSLSIHSSAGGKNTAPDTAIRQAMGKGAPFLTGSLDVSAGEKVVRGRASTTNPLQRLRGVVSNESSQQKQLSAQEALRVRTASAQQYVVAELLLDNGDTPSGENCLRAVASLARLKPLLSAVEIPNISFSGAVNPMMLDVSAAKIPGSSEVSIAAASGIGGARVANRDKQLLQSAKQRFVRAMWQAPSSLFDPTETAMKESFIDYFSHDRALQESLRTLPPQLAGDDFAKFITNLEQEHSERMQKHEYLLLDKIELLQARELFEGQIGDLNLEKEQFERYLRETRRAPRRQSFRTWQLSLQSLEPSASVTNTGLASAVRDAAAVNFERVSPQVVADVVELIERSLPRSQKVVDGKTLDGVFSGQMFVRWSVDQFEVGEKEAHGLARKLLENQLIISCSSSLEFSESHLFVLRSSGFWAQ